MKSLGINIIRYKNKNIINDLPKVIDELKEIIGTASHSSLSKRGVLRHKSERGEL
ncbi:hypothetical protein HZB07_07090 [Candidatus Saganbacteria bacterium]|nr:hypothetical protein [Candidatus Saganbacteria bacterium]